ncbi:MAG: bacterial Ig-like domain-containing protein [Clostridia bacterium]|nr:bacterial Ig-like domain-containing protein [Clostridia bacterium]
MRLLKAAALTVLLLLPLASAFPAAAAGELYAVAPGGTYLYSEADEFSDRLARIPDGTVLESAGDDGFFITASYSGRKGFVPLADLAAYPDDGGYTALEVISPPDKTVYYEDEEPDLTGLRVAAVGSGGARTEIKDYTVTTGGFYAAGTGYITVTRGSLNVKIPVAVVKMPIEEISVVSLPDKTEFKQGSAFDPSGMKVTARLTDGSVRDIKYFACSGFEPGAPGEQTVTVEYKGFTDEIKVTVIPRVLTRLSVKTPPDKTVYYGTDIRLDLRGLTLTADYDNGDSETVDPEGAEMRDAVVLGENTVTVLYGGAETVFSILCKPILATGISVTPPEKTVYKVGEEADYAGLIVWLNFNSGERRAVEDYEIVTVLDTSRPAEKDVFIRYGEYETFFPVSIRGPAVRGDADGDGSVTANDARVVLRAAAKLDLYDTALLDTCDIDRDGAIDATDARRILRAAAKLEDLE